MHPAFSVIFFTVTSGTGYGALIFLAIIALFNTQAFVSSDLNFVFLISAIIALIMIALGVVSSSFHLANKKNVWRAFFRFRSSWLSREGILALLSFPVTIIFIGSFYLWHSEILTQIFATITLLIAVLTVYSTGMIYACLKTIRAWNTPLVPFNYVLLAMLSGNLFLMTVFSYYDITSAIIDIMLTILVMLGILSKIIYYLYIDEPSSFSVKTATNLTGSTVRLLDSGESATHKNFLMKEFGFTVNRSNILWIRGIAIILMFVVPSVLFFNYHVTITMVFMAFVANYCGTLIERWLFFAEAKHVVNLFYGKNI